jgi:O-antigen ligase
MIPPASTPTTLDRARRTALLAVMATMPFVQEALPALLVVLVLLLLPWGVGVARLRSAQEPRPALHWRGPLPWLSLWYLLHAVGLAWTTDMHHGLFALEVRLMALLLPLVMLVSPAFWRDHAGAALRTFAHATGVALLFLMLRATWLFIAELRLRATGDHPDGLPYTNIFFSTYFSPWIHPSYVALFAVFALAVLAFRTHGGSLWQRWVLPAALLLGLLLTASKSGWIALVLLGMVLLRAKGHDAAWRKRLLIAAAGTAVVFGLLVASFGTVRGKITETWAALRSTDASAHDSSGARVLVWRAAMTLVVEHPLTGVGTGDAERELTRIYAERGYSYPLEQRLNAHSQFLQSAVQLGLPAALLLLLALLVPLPGAWRRSDHLAVFFLLVVLLNAAVESILEVQPGVMFVVLMSALLFPLTTTRPPA